MITVEEGYLKNKYGKDLDSCTGLMSMDDFMLYKTVVKKRRDENGKTETKKGTAITDKVM